MLLTNQFVESVDEVAHIFRIDSTMTEMWNSHRHDDEPRLVCGWVWSSKNGSGEEQCGLASMTAAYIDAWYHLVHKQTPPRLHGSNRLKKGKK